MSQNEWWFDLTEHEFTVEYKEETKKWFLVVKRKPKTLERKKIEDKKR